MQRMRALVTSEHRQRGITQVWVQRMALQAMVASRLSDDAELSVLLTNDAHMQELNASWRGKDHTTDVLSFPQKDPPMLGDVVISVPTAARQARDLGSTLQEEMARLLVHGLLHLLGHDHEQRAERLRMRRAERRVLAAMANFV